MYRNTIVWSLLFMIAASLPVEAQSFAQAQQELRVGRPVSVKDVSGTVTAGLLRQVSPDAITVDVGEHQRLFTPAEVEEITAPRKTPLAGSLIGLVVGSVIGAASGGCGGDQKDEFNPVSCSSIVVVSGLVGAGAGALLGSIPRTQRVYRHVPGLAAAPLLQRGRVGVMVRMHW